LFRKVKVRLSKARGETAVEGIRTVPSKHQERVADGEKQSKRRVRVKRGVNTRSAASKTAGDRTNRRGWAESNWVMRVRIKEDLL